jgi:hypothetical protein
MWWRSIVLFVVLLVVGTLRPLAHATPPDPTYVPGLYDDGDYDDVVVLASSTPCVLDGTPPASPPVAFLPCATIVPHRTVLPVASIGDASLTRGPPIG